MCNTESKQAPSVVLQVSDTGPGTSSLVLVPWYSTELKLHVPYGYPTPQVWTQSATARAIALEQQHKQWVTHLHYIGMGPRPLCVITRLRVRLTSLTQLFWYSV